MARYFLSLTILVFCSISCGWGNLKSELSSGLVDRDGQPVSMDVLNGKMVCLYFSASWCGPCKRFTPILQEFYQQNKDHVEVVFVSQDRSEEDQLKYMQDFGMTWPALKWEDTKENVDNPPRHLMNKYSGWGIPTLVVLSPRGEVLDANAADRLRNSPEERVATLKSKNVPEIIEEQVNRIQERGRKVSSQQKREFRRTLEDKLKKDLREAEKDVENSKKPIITSSNVSWDDLVAQYHYAKKTGTSETP